MFGLLKKGFVPLAVVAAIVFFTSAPVFAGTPSAPDITLGLGSVNADTLANKIVSIAIKGAAVAGAVAAFMLTYLGFKLKTSGERDRAETKEQIVWVFIGLALVGCAALIAGFAASAISNSVT